MVGIFRCHRPLLGKLDKSVVSKTQTIIDPPAYRPLVDGPLGFTPLAERKKLRSTIQDPAVTRSGVA